MSAWTGAAAVRVICQVQRLHDLGARPLMEFLTELASDPATRADIELNLFRYARLDPGIVAALGGSELRSPVFVVTESDRHSLRDDQRVRGAA